MSVWQPPSLSTNRPPPLLYNAANGWIFHIRALSILERASKLMYLPPEPGWEAALRENPQPGLGGSGSAEYTPSPPGGLGFGWGSAWSPNQTIDDFLRAQNAAVSMMADSPMNGNGGGGGGGFGNGMSAGSGGGGTGGWTSQAGSGSGSGLGSTPSSWSQLPGAGPAAAGGALSDSGRGWTRCARVRTPKAYEQVHQALIKMESDLPPDRRTNWETWDGKLGSWLFDGKMRKEPLSLVSPPSPSHYFPDTCSKGTHKWDLESENLLVLHNWLLLDVPLRRLLIHLGQHTLGQCRSADRMHYPAYRAGPHMGRDGRVHRDDVHFPLFTSGAIQSQLIS